MPTGNIRTLYEDKAHTKAIFPTTKVSAVTDDAGNALEDMIGQRYMTADLLTTDWNIGSYNSEGCYVQTITVAEAKEFKHPLISLLPSSISAMTEEEDAFSLLIVVKEINGAIEFYSLEVPDVDYTVQVKDY